MRARHFASLVLVAALPAAHAADFTSVGSLVQDEFHRLSQDLGAAMAYKGVTPATPLGVVGFDIGVVVTDTKLENSTLFSRAGAGSHSHLVIPKIHAYKGLFGGLDVGAFVAGATGVSATVFGADLRYAFLDDTLARPALAVRLSGTKATGLGELSLATAALDILASKKFTALTPYVGAGMVRVQTKAGGTGLAEERFNQSRVFGGLNVNLIGVNLAFEAEKMGSNTSLSAKVGWRF
jgi:hypothetical protein